MRLIDFTALGLRYLVHAKTDMHQVLQQKCIMGYGQMSIWVTKSVECRWGTIGVEEAVLLSFMAFTTALTTLFLVLFVWGWNREDRFNFLFRRMTSLRKWLEPILLWVNDFMPVTAVKKKITQQMNNICQEDDCTELSIIQTEGDDY